MSWPLPGTDGAAAKRQQGAHTIKVHTLTGRVKGSNVILHVTYGEVLTSAKTVAVGIWQRLVGSVGWLRGTSRIYHIMSRLQCALCVMSAQFHFAVV